MKIDIWYIGIIYIPYWPCISSSDCSPFWKYFTPQNDVLQTKKTSQPINLCGYCLPPVKRGFRNVQWSPSYFGVRYYSVNVQRCHRIWHQSQLQRYILRIYVLRWIWRTLVLLCYVVNSKGCPFPFLFCFYFILFWFHIFMSKWLLRFDKIYGFV